jgi:hypothetical protein
VAIRLAHKGIGRKSRRFERGKVNLEHAHFYP